MSVLLVTGIFPPDAGGPARYVPALADQLQRRGHLVTVLTLADSPDRNTAALSYEVYRIRRSLFRPLRVLWTIRQIRRLAARCDVVYVNGLALEATLATLGYRPRVMKVVGDLVWERAQNAAATRADVEAFQTARLSFYWRVLRRLQRWYARRADAVVVPSQYLRRLVRAWGIAPERIRVIENAITDAASAAAVPSNGAGLPQVDCVTVARLVPWKGVADLIFLARQRGFSLTVVGDGPQRAALQRMAHDLKVEQQVQFKGTMNRAEVQRELRNAKVFVLNSTYEGLPHVILEARAAGVPVVATAAGGTPEVVQNGVNGILVDAGDRDALGDAIQTLLDQPEHRARLAAASGMPEARFSFDTMITATESVLLETCRRRAS